MPEELILKLQSLWGSMKPKSPYYKDYRKEIHEVFREFGKEIVFTALSSEGYGLGTMQHLRFAFKDRDRLECLVVVKEKNNTSTWSVSYIKQIDEPIEYPSEYYQGY